MTFLTKTPSLIASLLSLTVLTATVVGCDDGGNDPMPESGGDDSGGDESGGEDSGGSGPEQQAEIDLTGTWTLTADYEVYCEYFANENQEARSVTQAVTLTGDNADLVGDLDFFQITGSGNDSGLRLSGSFPLMGIDQVALSGRDNMIAFSSTEVSEDEVTGDLSGRFDESNGAHCEIVDGSFEMTR